MNLDLVERITREAAAADGVEPLDEGAWLSLRSDDDRWGGVVSEDGFALTHGEDLHLVVRPEARGRGLATGWVRELSGPRQGWCHGGHPAADRLARRFGFARVRDLWVMRRAMDEPLPARADDPRIRAYRDADAAELLRVNAAAFADHPEQGAMDEANLAARMAEPWFDPAGLLVATQGERMLGFHWTKQHSPALGEVYVVGIDPAAQGQGLGRSLTLAGLHHLAGLGVEEVLLYVEADNRPALATYSRLGFTHAEVETHVMYRRDS